MTMAYTKKDFSALSSDGIHVLRGVIYLPEGEARGYLQVVHGMTEHIERYHRFMSEMAEDGYICFGYNHLGHKGTADDSELGFIAKKRGFEYLCRDVKVFSDAVRATYGEALPYYLLGHSMGSFIVRVASAYYVRPDKLIIMGSAGKNPAAGAGLLLIGIIKLFCGDRHFSPLIDKIAFGSYNDRFGGGTDDDPKPWLTRDGEARRAYYADRYCMFDFSVSAMGDLIRLIKEANSRRWYASLPKDMPILLVSGSDDPVGNYSKGITEVDGKLRAIGISSSAILYDGARHEILNDVTYEQVVRDICDFLV